MLGRMVCEGCPKATKSRLPEYFAIEDLRSRFNQTEQDVRQLKEGSDSVRTTVTTKTCVSSIELSLFRADSMVQAVRRCRGMSKTLTRLF